MKSSWSSLCEIQEKQPLARESDRNGDTATHYKYDKDFLVAAHGSIGIGSSIRAR